MQIGVKMIKILLIILVLLLIIIGGERGIITLITLIGSILTLSFMVLLMYWGVSPILATIIGAILICAITILYQNNKNEKTVVSFISVLIIVIAFFAFAYFIGIHANIYGFNEIEVQELTMYYSADIHINMVQLGISVIIIGLLGAIMDTSMVISSGMYEIFENNKQLSFKEIYSAGINIGKDVLSSTINTLLFAYIGESILLFNLFINYRYSVIDIINSKAFSQNVMCILFSAIGCVIIIPLTAVLEAYVLTKNKIEINS